MGFSLGFFDSSRWSSVRGRDRAPACSPSGYRRAIDRGLLLAGLALILSLSAGCGGKDRLAVNPVRGRVEYQGQGIPGAVVIFHPQEDANEKAKKMRPFAYADAEGNF